jgi:hypothetical protein
LKERGEVVAPARLCLKHGENSELYSHNVSFDRVKIDASNKPK